MKTLKTLMLGAVVALGIASASQAATKSFYLTGSSAFRSQVHAAIMHKLGSVDYSTSTGAGTIPSGSTVAEGTSFGYAYTGTGSNLGKASQAIFVGKIGTQDVVIYTAFTGSEAGLYSCGIDSGAGVNVNFIALAGTTRSLAGTNGATSATGHLPDAAMSDTLQSTSQFFGGAKVKYSDNSIHTMASLSQDAASPVGVTYFTFKVTKSGKTDVGHNGATVTDANGITNITSAQAKQLFSSLGGPIPVNMFLSGTFDGGSTDGTTDAQVYGAGRDPDSGTRLTTFGEIGLGSLSVATQFVPYNSSNAVISGTNGTETISYIDVSPATVVNNVTVIAANGGYNSGGNLCTALNGENGNFNIDSSGDLGAVGSCLITYAGIGDSGNLATGQQLTFNGVAASDATVADGSYPLWTYEHMYYRPSADTTVGNLIAAQLQSNDAAGTGCLKLTSMKVERINGSKDGGSPITPK